MKTIHLIALLLLPAFSYAAAATPSAPNEENTDTGSPSPWRLGIALGYGERSNPLILSDDIPIAVDLDIAWFGERFFFDNGDIGMTFLDNASVTANLVGRANSERVFFAKTNTKFVSLSAAGEPLSADVPLSVPDRNYAAELGVEILADGLWGQLQLAAFHDVSDVHNGYELFADYSYGWRRQRLYLEPSFGLSFKSESLNDYYWGVRADEANEALPAYQAGAGVNAYARVHASYQITRQWTFALVAEYERLNNEATASPIVAEQFVLGYFAGFAYRF